MTPQTDILDEIGRQHDALAMLFDDVSARIFDPTQRDGAAERLSNLLLETGMHFGFEEALMEDGGYPQLDQHRRQHLAMMLEFGLLLDQVTDGGNVRAVVRGVELLKRWFEQHVEHSDCQLECWLLSRA